ncbi:MULTISPECIES: hypothetical protein [Trichocoleus]|uniref:Uncharacterized protein n=1 Tax=Trichocoleus desertorum GB2-A4 TaxID=2933944 RepID=A0ABV0J363_9CYAN|nr:MULTISPECIES: hypothetical protein [unclassified Trichocoleus]MBD1861553.1 hypothetical protein [Trichocoleus sp. FACHB-46]MBD2098437.1 hypothetical protein [Trichocoleus sp. FACHB-591]
MQEKLLISPKQKEELFHTELVKHGVPFYKAAKVANILVSAPSDETLTEEEIQLAKDACREWLKQRKRLDLVLRTVETVNLNRNKRSS